MEQPTSKSIPKAPSARSEQRRFHLFPLRIRSKLIFLHTMFSLGLALILLLALRSPVQHLVQDAEMREAEVALALSEHASESPEGLGIDGVTIRRGSAAALELDPTRAAEARATPGTTLSLIGPGGAAIAMRFDESTGEYSVASVRHPGASAAITRLYLVVTLALLAMYGLIAVTIEVFVLPRQVYRPIAKLRSADLAVQAGERGGELIDEADIPMDELGEIMRSRNESIMKLRMQERALEEAVERLEIVAAELKRKNFLLEAAKRNIADQDRLVSLGMMSAGLAHELNTPLAVLKGCTEELASSGDGGFPSERIELMRRVVMRLENLSESLLDFARVRPRSERPLLLAEVVAEAWTLVSIDRDVDPSALRFGISADHSVLGDENRLTQVFVNLLRNATDAIDGRGPDSWIRVSSEQIEREERRWISATITDNGPGIDPGLLDRLFEPFASTRLDSHGTGLGLAVAEGIIREHGGVIIARNASAGGAQFEVLLPAAEATDPNTAHSDTLRAEAPGSTGGTIGRA